MSSWEENVTFATLPRTTRGMPIVLGGDPKGKNFLYTNGTSVIIRNIDNPFEADIYTQHSVPTTVAKYSPSGFYIASADQSGKVRIWDTVNKEHLLKNEFQPFAGPVKDLVWSGDNQRICVVGEGREKFGHVFNAETGTSVGEILGQSKSLNSVDMRPSRPFKIVTASEDNTLAFFEGPPFKFKFTMNEHQRFVNCVRYSPDGETFISGGADGKSFIYDGKTGQLKGELGSPAHKGGIYGVCFNADSTKVLTVSADKTAKIWDVATATVLTEFILGTTVQDMQVGCLWQGDHIITVSLSGFINYLDVNNPTTPLRVVKGHNKPITALAVSDDRTTIYTAGVDGVICCWNAQGGSNDMFEGQGHKSQVQDLVVKDGMIYSCAMDDTVIASSLTEKKYGSPVQLPSQPQKMAVTDGGLQIIPCANEIVGIRGLQKVFTLPAAYEPSCIAIHSGQNEVAVGGKDSKLRIYTLSGETMTESRVLDHMTALTDVKYSPDGAYLIASDAGRRIHLYQLPDYSVLIDSQWTAHTARVTSINWAPSSQYFVSGSLDTNLICFEPPKPRGYAMHKGAHPMNQINRVKFLNENSIISVGQDSNLKLWNLKHA